MAHLLGRISRVKFDIPTLARSFHAIPRTIPSAIRPSVVSAGARLWSPFVSSHETPQYPFGTRSHWYKMKERRRRAPYIAKAKADLEKMKKGLPIGTPSWPWPKYTLGGTVIGRKVKTPKPVYPQEFSWEEIAKPRGREFESMRQKRVYTMQVHLLRRDFKKEAMANQARELARIRAEVHLKYAEKAKEIIYEKQRKLRSMLSQKKQLEAQKKHVALLRDLQKEFRAKKEQTLRKAREQFTEALARDSENYITLENLDKAVATSMTTVRDYNTNTLSERDQAMSGVPRDLRDVLSEMHPTLPTDRPLFGDKNKPGKSSR